MAQEGGQLPAPPLFLSVPFRGISRSVSLGPTWLAIKCRQLDRPRLCPLLLHVVHAALQCYLLPPGQADFRCMQHRAAAAAAGSLLQQSWSYHFLALFMFDFVNLFYLLHYLSMQLSIPTRYYSFPWHFPTAFANRPRPLTILPRPTVSMSPCPSVFLSSLAWPCFIFHLNNL